MIVKMLSIARGPNFSADPGDLKDVSDEHGAELIAAGHAEFAETLCDPPEGLEAAASPAARRSRAVAGKRATR